MRKVYIGLGVVGVLGLGYALFRYLKTQSLLLQDYTYKIVGVKIKKVSKNELTFDLVIRFFSKSDVEATVNNLYLDIFVEGTNVGFISETNSFVIPAKGNSDIPLEFSFNPQLVFKSALGLILTGVQKKDIAFGIKGKANIKSGFISTTIPIEYNSTVKAYI